MSNEFEPYLASPTRTLAVLEKYGFNFKKSLGQNFLIDANIVEEIIEGSLITKEDTVLEIGPGIGTLTQYLAKHARDVVAVELDKSLIPILEYTLQGLDNVTIINGDILKQDIESLINERQKLTYNHSQTQSKTSFKVVSNLPYYITTPIVMNLLESGLDISSITIMIQSEVADRINAKPATKDYGVLTLAINYYASVTKILDVSPNCFMPRPKVGSTVVRLDKYENRPVKVQDAKRLFQIIRGGFSMRRKTLVNSLGNYGISNCSKDKVLEALDKMGLDSRIRGEVLSLNQYVELMKYIDEM